MADFHNISDLRAINLLEAQLRDIQFELKQWGGYDPTESLAENARIMLDCGKLLGRIHEKLQIQHRELKQERENDKKVARTYPFADDPRNGTFLLERVPKTNGWPGWSGSKAPGE